MFLLIKIMFSFYYKDSFQYVYKQPTIEMIFIKHLLHIKYKQVKECGPVSFFLQLSIQ